MLTILGKTWTYLRDGYHPTEYYDPHPHSIEEIAQAWNVEPKYVTRLIEEFERNSLASRLSKVGDTKTA